MGGFGSGRPEKYDNAELLSLLTKGGLTQGDWFRKAHNKLGISRARFCDKIAELKATSKVSCFNGPTHKFGNSIKSVLYVAK